MQHHNFRNKVAKCHKTYSLRRRIVSDFIPEVDEPLNITVDQLWSHIGYQRKIDWNTEGCSKLKRSVTSSGKNGLNIRTNASPKWDSLGARRSCRPLLASRTRCNGLWKPPKFGNKVKIGNKVQFGNKLAVWLKPALITLPILFCRGSTAWQPNWERVQCWF